MDITKLKAELFEIRRQIDILEQQRAQLIQLYNKKLGKLNEIEKKQGKKNEPNSI